MERPQQCKHSGHERRRNATTRHLAVVAGGRQHWDLAAGGHQTRATDPRRQYAAVNWQTKPVTAHNRNYERLSQKPVPHYPAGVSSGGHDNDALPNGGLNGIRQWSRVRQPGAQILGTNVQESCTGVKTPPDCESHFRGGRWNFGPALENRLSDWRRSRTESRQSRGPYCFEYARHSGLKIGHTCLLCYPSPTFEIRMLRVCRTIDHAHSDSGIAPGQLHQGGQVDLGIRLTHLSGALPTPAGTWALGS